MTPPPGAMQDVALRRLFRLLFFRGRAGRRPRGGTPKSMAVVLWVSLILYVAMGAMAFVFPMTSVLAFAAPLHGITFFLTTMYVSASAGDVLFHRDEADILLHRPVLPQTLLRAKVRVLVEVTWWLIGSFNLIGLLLGASPRVAGGGWPFLISHTLAVAMEALLVVGCVVVVYELCLRFFGRAHLDRLMTASQVTMSVAGVVLWQLTPHAGQPMAGTVVADLTAWWTWLLPPYWFAAFDAAATGQRDGITLGLAATGVIVTGMVLVAAFGRLAQSYGEGLQALGENPAMPKKRGGARRPYVQVLVDVPPLSWWLRDAPSKAGFVLTTLYLLRDREIKLRIYPQVASVLALCLAIGLRRTDGSALSACCCLLAVTPLNALESMRYSQQWQAADVFRCIPLRGPGPLCDGARRAVLLWLFAPVALVLGVVALTAHDTAMALPTVAACLALVPLYARIPSWNGKGIPLALPNEDMRPRRGFMYVGILLLSATVLGLAMFAQSLGWLAYFLGAEAAALGVIDTYARRRLEAVTWAAVDAP